MQVVEPICRGFYSTATKRCGVARAPHSAPRRAVLCVMGGVGVADDFATQPPPICPLRGEAGEPRGEDGAGVAWAKPRDPNDVRPLPPSSSLLGNGCGCGWWPS